LGEYGDNLCLKILIMGGKQRNFLLGLTNLYLVNIYWVFIAYIRHRGDGNARWRLRHPAAGASRGIERHEGEQAGGHRACEITKMKTEY
jgi:hypothetical protein